MMQEILMTIILNFGGGQVTITMEHPSMVACEQELAQIKRYFSDGTSAEIIEAKCESV